MVSLPPNFAGAQQIITPQQRAMLEANRLASIVAPMYAQLCGVGLAHALQDLAVRRKEWRERLGYVSDEDLPKPGEDGGPPQELHTVNNEVLLAMSVENAKVLSNWLDSLEQ